MIYVRLDAIDFENEITEIIRLFFSDNEIEYVHTDPLMKHKGIFLYGSIAAKKGQYAYTIKLSGKAAGQEYRVPLTDGIPERSQLEARKTFKREVRRGVYTVLSYYTGKQLPWGMLTGIRPGKIVHELLEKGLGKKEIDTQLKEYYMISGQKAALLYDVAAVEKEILQKTSDDRISLYIGIPFCMTRCLYCSFTSNPIARYANLVDEYIKALKKEIASVGALIQSRGMKVQSLYIGGGTPTSIDAASLKDLLDFIEDSLDLRYLEEYTLEAGRPDSIDEEKLRVIKNSAVDRISINPQTMCGETLKLIGRNHSPEDVCEAFKLARKMGFANINMDVIIGLPGENTGILEDTLKQIRKMGPESLTVHTMAIKRASRLKMEAEKYPLISGEEASSMVDTAGEYARSMGMRPYYLYRQKNILGNLENIGYCKPGFESIYNVQIMEERQTILALGAGAVTKVVYPSENRIERAFNVKGIEEYIARIEEMIARKKILSDFIE